MSNQIVWAWVNGLGLDQPVERIAFINGTPRNRQVVHADGLGSVAALTDESGATVQTYAYAAFGGVREQTGHDLNRVTFTAREAMGDSLGFYYYRHRVYDPTTGRFTAKDPLGFVDGANRYVYVGNNPVNNVDPFGLITIAIPGLGPQTDVGGESSNEAFIRGVLGRDASAQVVPRNQLGRALESIKKARKEGDECVTIYGYSRGGVAALDLAKLLGKQGVRVNSLITIDPVRLVGGRALPVPSNVDLAVNHYQRGARLAFTDFPGTPLTGKENVLNLEYPNGSVNNWPVRHENMPSIVLQP